MLLCNPDGYQDIIWYHPWQSLPDQLFSGAFFHPRYDYGFLSVVLPGFCYVVPEVDKDGSTGVSCGSDLGYSEAGLLGIHTGTILKILFCHFCTSLIFISDKWFI